MLVTMFIMLAFAGVYALIAAMVGGRWPAIGAAVRGGAAAQESGNNGVSRALRRS